MRAQIEEIPYFDVQCSIFKPVNAMRIDLYLLLRIFFVAPFFHFFNEDILVNQFLAKLLRMGKGCIKMKICTLMNEKKNGEMMKENVKWWIWNDKQQFLPHFYSCEFAINISSEMNDAWFDRWCKIKFITHALSRTLNIIRTISAFIVISWSNGEQFYA